MRNSVKIIFFFLFIFQCQLSIINAQIAINSDGASPDSSAILDISSSEKGMLIPRMTTSERTAISSPATGLLIYDTDQNTFWYFNGSAWTEVGGGAFTSEDGLTYATHNSDDFLFGADSLNYGSGNESKLFMDKSIGAFRVGSVSDKHWDTDSLGYNSIGIGTNVKAKGSLAIAFGSFTEASGAYSTAFGYLTQTSNSYSTAFGSETQASGAYATAFGGGTQASGTYATAFGTNTTATDYASTAFGYLTQASGAYATAFGGSTQASAHFTTAFGNQTTASGIYSTAFGHETKAFSFGEIAMGLYSTTYSPNDSTSFDTEDRLLVLGNGTDDANRSDALIVYKSGDTEINGDLTITGSINSTNTAFISENGITYSNSNSDDFIFGADSLNHGTGTESKFFFDADQSAFRAGGVNGGAWDSDSLGLYSFAAGYNANAADDYTIALGRSSIANATHAIAIGREVKATGFNATALGKETEASGFVATAFGRATEASGSYATSFGWNTNAPSYGETAIGFNNTTYTPNNTSSFNNNDRLFVIGNGSSASSRSDALIIYKNGNATLAGDLTANSTTYPSDVRLKKNIEATQYGLSDILQINVRDYQFKKDSTGHLHTGFLAQQLNTIFPHAVREGGEDENIHPWSVDYASITPLLVKGMQEQQKVIQEQQQENEDLKNRVSALENQLAKINQLETKLQQLEAAIPFPNTAPKK